MIKINALSPEQRKLNAAIAAFNTAQYEKPFAARHPELGKMVNCQYCNRRHRLFERPCKQVFTYTMKDENGKLMEQYRMDEEKNELVPDYRTAMRPDEKPKKGQVVGRAAFAKKRLKPHPSKIKLLFIQKTREIFSQLGFSLDDKAENFKENLQRCRVLAARDIRQEREFRDWSQSHAE
jgi:hypothetical protein